AVCGGEDYELLVAVPPARAGRLERLAAAWRTPLTPIGEIRPARDGVVLVDRAGRPYRPPRPGFAHF
ncbi:MAG TPA: thiamine-phosphate kinase, partial [Thermodesulfobacteriota bacterium]|nr:thiamine-phosphate kinase [Thermodesulfobacteriota bacterium]